MGHPDLDQSYDLDSLTLDELSALHAAMEAHLRGSSGYVPGWNDDGDRSDPSAEVMAEDMKAVEHEIWSRLLPWMQGMRIGIESAVAERAPGMEVHVAISTTYPGLPIALGLAERPRVDVVGQLALVGFVLRVRPVEPGATDDHPPWQEVFLGGVDLLTGDVYDREGFSHKAKELADVPDEPGLAEPDFWPSFLLGTLLSPSTLASMISGAFAEFAEGIAVSIGATIVEEAITGPGFPDDPPASIHENWRTLLDAYWGTLEAAAEEDAEEEETSYAGDDEDKENVSYAGDDEEENVSYAGDDEGSAAVEEEGGTCEGEDGADPYLPEVFQ